MPADFENRRRFATGYAGPNYTPIDILNIDLDNWLLDPSAANGIALSAPGNNFAWQPPEYLNPPQKPAAGVRFILNGGVADSTVRIGAFSDALLTANEFNVSALLAKAPLFRISANQTLVEKFFVPRDRSLGILVVSGGLASHELHWMLGV
jgi:hypothetical protein